MVEIYEGLIRTAKPCEPELLAKLRQGRDQYAEGLDTYVATSQRFPVPSLIPAYHIAIALVNAEIARCIPHYEERGEPD